MTLKAINIYSPKNPQGDSFILGNKKGLIALKYAIERAINRKYPSRVRVFTGKGEDFNLVVAESHVGIEDKLKDPFIGEYYSHSDAGLSPEEAINELSYE